MLGLCTLLARAAAQIPDPGFGDPTTLANEPIPGAFSGGGATNPYLPQTSGTMAPQQRLTPTRPSGWPGGVPTPIPGGYGALPNGARTEAYRTASLPPSAQMTKKSPADPPYDPAEILARVGSERIQACEMLPMVNRAIFKAVNGNAQFAALSPEEKQAEIYKAQRNYLQMAIKEMIRTKVLVSEARGAADAKQIKANEKSIRDFFNNSYMKELQAQYEASSVIDLENKLRALGGSIESQRALFVEQHLASGWLNQAVPKEDKQPTHDDMLTYYRAHAEKWQSPARARWEQLTAKWENYNTREEARAAMARWGNDLLVRKVPFAEVAKAHSQDFAAEDGGLHDWSTKGSLRSTTLDEALFSLPVGALSRILEDEDGCHIIRVVEREEASQAAFLDVQPEIRKELHDGGDGQRKMEYIKTLLERTPVWTVFDEAPSGADALQR